MKVLLDTHALLWMLEGDERVPQWLIEAGETGNPVLLVSHVSIWEVAIKASLGRVEVVDDLPSLLEEVGVNWLEITAEHVWGVKDLPFHHRDPFDRLLVAQALHEDLVVATSDPAFSKYGAPVRWER